MTYEEYGEVLHKMQSAGVKIHGQGYYQKSGEMLVILKGPRGSSERRTYKDKSAAIRAIPSMAKKNETRTKGRTRRWL